MNRYFYTALCCALFLVACREQGEDLGWEAHNKQETIKTELLKELDTIFDVAWQNPQKAEEQIVGLITIFTQNTPVMEKDPKLISAKTYADQAIHQAYFLKSIRNEMSRIDYSQVHPYIHNDGSVSVLKACSDPSLLFGYIKQINAQRNSFKSKASRLAFRNAEHEKKLDEKLDQLVSEVQAKLKSYPQLSGKEKLLENTCWVQITYVGQETEEGDPYIEQGTNEKITLRFKTDNRFECDSVFLPDFYHGIPYGFQSDEGLNSEGFKEILSRAAPGLPLESNFRAGKEIRKEGEYYFGENYLTLVFHLMDDYDLVLMTDYHTDLFDANSNGKLVPLRDPKPENYAAGNSRTYLGIINGEKHFGTVQCFDGMFIFKERYLAPFAWLKN